MKLKEWMKKRAFRSTSLAYFLGINKSYVSRILSGEKKPSKEILVRIRVLTANEVSTFEDLIGEEDGEAKDTRAAERLDSDLSGSQSDRDAEAHGKSRKLLH